VRFTVIGKVLVSAGCEPKESVAVFWAVGLGVGGLVVGDRVGGGQQVESSQAQTP
jgi:hypothetical protein